jgi:threonine dehydrogenase-like Zn-dependent dehydrogenase
MPYFSLYKIPDTLSFEEASLLQPFGVAVRSFETLFLFKPGDDVAILGCGPIGLLQGLLAKTSGAGKIFMTGLAIDKKRLELARQLGFTTINAEEQPVRDIILDNTQGMGVDVVFDATTSGVPMQSVSLLKKVGQLCLTSVMEDLVTFNGKELTLKEILISFPKARNPSSFRRAVNLMASGRIDVKSLITHKLGVEDAEKGFKMLQNREGMKVLIMP